MIKLLLRGIIAGFLLVASQWACATNITLKPNHPSIYYVKEGDTLWDIAGKFLQHEWQWPQIWQNNQQVTNPHLIYPGDSLHLSWIDGKPHISIERGDKFHDGYPVVKLSPKAIAHPITDAIPAVSLDSIQPFLLSAQVVTRSTLDKAPYLLGGADSRNIWAAGDSVYVRSPDKAWNSAHTSYGVYQVGKPYIDPQSGEVLGYEALLVGQLKLEKIDADIATMKVISSNRGLKVNDRILPSVEHKQLARYFPQPPNGKIDGRIIRLFDALNEVARHDVVVINKGLRDGLVEGNLLQIREPGELVEDKNRQQYVRLPSKKVGNMLLFRVFDKVSFGLIMESLLPISKSAKVVTPE